MRTTHHYFTFLTPTKGDILLKLRINQILALRNATSIYCPIKVRAELFKQITLN